MDCPAISVEHSTVEIITEFFGNFATISDILCDLGTIFGKDQNQASIKPGNHLNWVSVNG